MRRVRIPFCARFHRRVKLPGRDVFHDGQMFRRRAQILSHREDLAADLAQIVHRLEQFRLRFAKAEHDAALGHDSRRKFFGALQALRNEVRYFARDRTSGVKRSTVSML